MQPEPMLQSWSHRKYRISSKSRRTYKEVGSTPHGKGSLDSKYAECRCTCAIRTIEMHECAGVRRVSGLVATHEISPPSKFHRRVQQLEIKSRRGEISRKYGNSKKIGYSVQGLVAKVNDTVAKWLILGNLCIVLGNIIPIYQAIRNILC